jgi:hypothetical protein
MWQLRSLFISKLRYKIRVIFILRFVKNDILQMMVQIKDLGIKDQIFMFK